MINSHSHLTEFERRAIMYYDAFVKTNDLRYLWNYLFWRACNEDGRECAVKNYMIYLGLKNE